MKSECESGKAEVNEVGIWEAEKIAKSIGHKCLILEDGVIRSTQSIASQPLTIQTKLTI